MAALAALPPYFRTSRQSRARPACRRPARIQVLRRAALAAQNSKRRSTRSKPSSSAGAECSQQITLLFPRPSASRGGGGEDASGPITGRTGCVASAHPHPPISNSEIHRKYVIPRQGVATERRIGPPCPQGSNRRRHAPCGGMNRPVDQIFKPLKSHGFPRSVSMQLNICNISAS